MFDLPPLHTDQESTLASLTAPGAVLGTYTYMAPEQLSGGTVTARSDLFAAGVIIVESLTGKRPFRGATLADFVRAVLHDPFHLDGDDAGIRRLDDCLQRALAKRAVDRYASASEARASLVPAIAACRGVRLGPGVWADGSATDTA